MIVSDFLFALCVLTWKLALTLRNTYNNAIESPLSSEKKISPFGRGMKEIFNFSYWSVTFGPPCIFINYNADM